MPGTDGAWSTTRFVEIDDLRHDMHVNIVNFQPGGAIPFPETHVMEHGLYVLEGKAVYLLNTDWVEVEAGDFMWLRAFCPQACYAGGPGPFRYLLYKDVNRHARPHPRWLRCELASLETSDAGLIPHRVSRLVAGAPRTSTAEVAPTSKPSGQTERLRREVGWPGSSSTASSDRWKVCRCTPTPSTSCAACGLTGAKEGCAEGECGACAVMVARPAADGSEATEWTAINSCLVPAATLDGQEVVTAEGLGAPEALHPVQQEMAVRGGSQCGYCTPGFVCSMAAEFYRAGRKATNGSTPEPHDGYHGDNGFDLHSLSGNLCRCTGYRPIKDAAYALGVPGPRDALAARRTAAPPAAVPTRLHDAEALFIRPTDLEQALGILAEEPEATVVAGSTDWGVDVNLKGAPGAAGRGGRPARELRGFERSATDEIRIGAALTLSEIERRLGRPAAAAGRPVPAVRVAADPQRRHARWQPRHRLAHRRRAAGAAGARGERGAGLGRR